MKHETRTFIQGKLYDTSTATLIGEADFGYRGDFRFFVTGEGGPLSHYARRTDSNTTSGGYGTRVLSAAEALEWAETYDVDADKIAEAFGDLVEAG